MMTAANSTLSPCLFIARRELAPSLRNFSLVQLLACFVVAAMPLFAQSQEPKVRGLHEVLDPTSQTDDLGISVPIPISHPARRYPATEDFPTGPAVGDALPDIRLPNQQGEMADVKALAAGQSAVVIFFRSAVW